MASSLSIVLLSPLGCETGSTALRELLAASYSQRHSALLECLPFVGFGKLFANLLRNTPKAALGVGSGFHQTMLGRRFARH